MSTTITEKAAVVTGGARGIGEELAAHVAMDGATVVIADRDEPTAADTAERLGDRVHASAVDVTDSAAIAYLVARTVDESGRPDILVNNAGVADDRPSAELTRLSGFRRRQHSDRARAGRQRRIYGAVTATLRLPRTVPVPTTQRASSGRP